MAITLLLDLDDTLLDINMQAFLPVYFEALARHLETRVSREVMLPALRAGIGLMVSNRDPLRTLQEVFETYFYPELGVAQRELRASIKDFYDRIFPRLRGAAGPRPGAKEVVQWALAQGHRVAITTDPLFPRQATEERIRWADLDPGSFDLIASFESFHFTKAQPPYFAEVLGRLGWPDRPVLTVGDDALRDVAPAQALGLATYQADGTQPARGQRDIALAEIAPTRTQGDLIQLKAWLETGLAEIPSAAIKAPEGLLAALAATPAALHGLTAELTPALWMEKPGPDDWALIELICHLRDTEREVHHLQLKTLLDDAEPFVPRPDAAVWAKQRNYLREDGPAALRAFASARSLTLDQLIALKPKVWSRPARHAIFGPTNFMEVVGFMADHDRMHIQQAWRTLASLQWPAHRK